jgi:glycerol-3-phosphate dehydrogenase
LVAEVNAALPTAGLSAAHVCHAFAGLYMLTSDVIRPDVFQGTGFYQIVDHGRDGIGGLVSVLGAKYTTARAVAERAVDLADRKLGVDAPPSVTATTPLVGGTIDDLEAFRRRARQSHAGRLPAETIEQLVTHYGSEMDEVIELGNTTPTGLEPLSSARETIEAEVMFTVAREMALTLEDVVFRRTGLGTIGHPGGSCLARCASLMGVQLGWDAARVRAEIQRVEDRFTKLSP